MADHPGENTADGAEEEETGGDPAVSFAVEAALGRLQELEDDVDVRPHSVTATVLWEEFQKGRTRAINIFERVVTSAGLHDDNDLDVIRGREEVEREAE